MPKKIFALCLGIFCLFPAAVHPRSLEELFPGLDPGIRDSIFSSRGFSQTLERDEGNRRFDSDRLAPRLFGGVMESRPSFLVESLLIVPRENDAVNLLTVYNALGKIRALKGRMYHSATRDRDIPLFEDATRIAGERKNTPLPDPGPAASIPPAETVYLRLKDANFGNSFYRGEIALTDFGISYRLSNFKNLSYLFVPVIREERFIAQIYIEIITEGILIYSIAGADVSDFVASRIDMPSAVAKRLAVIISWIADGVNS
jgi:hypothetical protein